MSEVRIGGVYRHYKGKLYYVLAIATHSESLEKLVVYVPLYESPEVSMWVRPLSMFTENVQIEGETVPRFAYEYSR